MEGRGSLRRDGVRCVGSRHMAATQAGESKEARVDQGFSSETRLARCHGARSCGPESPTAVRKFSLMSAANLSCYIFSLFSLPASLKGDAEQLAVVRRKC